MKNIERYRLEPINRNEVMSFNDPEGEWCKSEDVLTLEKKIESLKNCDNCTSAKPLKCVNCFRNNEPANKNFTDNWKSI